MRDTGPRIADPALWDGQPRAAPRSVARGGALQAHRSRRRSTAIAAPLPADGPPERIGRGTTAFAVVDADGNMIAVTQTLSTWGGTFYVSNGLGFLYNNHLRFGGGGAPGRFLPLARSSSTNVPTLLFTSGQAAPRRRRVWRSPRPATPGFRRRSTTSSSTSSTAAWTRSARSKRRDSWSAGIPPIRRAAGPQIEDRIPRGVLESLNARGHRFQKIGRKGEVRYGYAAAAVVDAGRRQVQGGAEPRRSHAAVGVTSATTAPQSGVK